MPSIRNRILLLVLGILCLSLPMISYKSYLDARHETEELFDAQLAQSTRLLGGLIQRHMSQEARNNLQKALDEALLHIRVSREEHSPSAQGHPYEAKVGFEVFTSQGRPLLKSAGMPETALQVLLEQHGLQDAALKLSEKQTHLMGFHYLTVEDHLWRLFLLHDRQDDLWILAGERNDIRGELTEKIAKRNLIPDLIGLPILAVLIWLAVNCGLRPLEQMITLLRARDPDNLSPMLLEPLPRELEPMAASLNRLLLQVNHLLEREKRFLADAAHELRTPLAVLRIHQQNALTAANEQDRNEALQHLGIGVERATRVVSQLLTLARLEPAAIKVNMKTFNLLQFVRTELAELTPLALAKGQELALEADESQNYDLLGDAPSLGILLQNLVSNAIQYTPEKGCIQVSLKAASNSITLCVDDNGPGVPVELREKLFERFFRVGTGQGAGLGLSIVSRITELHQARITLTESCLLGGFSVQIQLFKQPSLNGAKV